MAYLLNLAGALAGHLWWWLCAHFRVCYLLATLLALPAAFIGQGLVPYTGEYVGSIVTVVLQWYSFLVVYAFIQKGGFNPLLRRLCPWRSWDGPWWETTWPQAIAGLWRGVRRAKRPAAESTSPRLAGELLS